MADSDCKGCGWVVGGVIWRGLASREGGDMKKLELSVNTVPIKQERPRDRETERVHFPLSTPCSRAASSCCASSPEPRWSGDDAQVAHRPRSRGGHGPGELPWTAQSRSKSDCAGPYFAVHAWPPGRRGILGQGLRGAVRVAALLAHADLAP